MIVVTGATGQLGRGVVEALLARLPPGDIAVCVRDQAKATDIAERGVAAHWLQSALRAGAVPGAAAHIPPSAVPGGCPSRLSAPALVRASRWLRWLAALAAAAPPLPLADLQRLDRPH